MNTRKRQASESLLPLRMPKHPRTTRNRLIGGHPSPSQSEGILSRWMVLSREAVRLSQETFNKVMEELGVVHVEPSLPPPPSPPPSPPTPNTPQNAEFAQNVSPKMCRASKKFMDSSTSTSHLCHTDSQMTIDTASVSTTSTPMSTPSPTDISAHPPKVRRMSRSSAPPPSSPPHAGSQPNGSFTPPILATPQPIPSSSSLRDMPPPRLNGIPTASGSQVVGNSSNVRRGGSPIPGQLEESMGPPRSFPTRARQMNGSIVTPPSTATMSSSQPSSSDLENAYPQLAGMLATSRHRADSQYPDGIPRKYQNRDHIFQKTHKAQVRETRKKDRDEMVKELFSIRRNTGHTSDFATFQNWLDYGARLEQLEKKGALSPSPSLIDLRSRTATPTSRRHSLPEDINSDFLERTLEKARQALNGPKPPKPFSPSLDQLWLAARAKDEAIEQRLHLPTSLPPLDDAKVGELLRKRGVVSKHAREQVTDADISRLKPHQWLNDEIINFYGSMILGRSDECKENPGVNRVKGSGRRKPLHVHYFSTFFWPKLTKEGYEKGRLAKWTKKFDIFQKDVVLIPVNHHNMHWTGAAINFRRKRIESYDSMGVDRSSVYKMLRSYIDAEHRNKKKKPFDFTDWKDYTLEDTPQQENGFDCGVFTCQFLEALSRGEESFNFTQSDMPYLRRRMIWEIGNATLRDD